MTSYVVKEGYLYKSPPDDKSAVKSWRDRWFVLRTDGGRPVLEYFENQEKSLLKGSVSLGGRLEISVVTDYPVRQNVFCLKTPGRLLYMSAKDKTDMDQWVQSLSHTLKIPVQHHGRKFLMLSHTSFFKERSQAKVSEPSAPSAPSGLPPNQKQTSGGDLQVSSYGIVDVS